MEKIYNELKKKINNIELVDDIEYYDNWVEGIIVYFPNGECLQIFKDIDNKVSNNNNYIVLDPYFNIALNTISENEIINYTLHYNSICIF